MKRENRRVLPTQQCPGGSCVGKAGEKQAVDMLTVPFPSLGLSFQKKDFALDTFCYLMILSVVVISIVVIVTV